MIQKICIVASILFFAACGAQQEKDKLLPPDGRAGGQLGGSGWAMTSAIFYNENGKLDITIAGEGDNINCANSVPQKNHLTFLVPPQVGRYEFDLNKPSSAPVFFVFRQGQKVEMKIAKQSLIQIDSIAANRVQGRLVAESSGTGNLGGSVTGAFEATLCQ